MRYFLALAMAASTLFPGQAQTGCSTQGQEVFAPLRKTVVLASKSGAPANAQFVLFQSKSRVNTDGAPNSYHPDDPESQTKAINNIANGIRQSGSCRKSGTNLRVGDNSTIILEELEDLHVASSIFKAP